MSLETVTTEYQKRITDATKEYERKLTEASEFYYKELEKLHKNVQTQVSNLVDSLSNLSVTQG